MYDNYLCIASDWGFLLYVYKGFYLRPYDGKLSLLSIYQKSLLHSSPLPFPSFPSQCLSCLPCSEGLVTLKDFLSRL